jgi:L-threonylcarbamoyladenylate synthase
MKTIIQPANQDTIQLAADLLQHGKLVAIPTETVYGLGADARNSDAVKRIFAAKGRPADHPLIVHIPDKAALTDWAIEIPEIAWKLAEHFWPGPLTLVLKKHPDVPMEVTGGQDTVALRVPNHPVALAVLTAFGGGIAAPSANRFCRISPTQASHVEEELGDKVDMILDGGACQVGLESTIVDLSGDQPRLLRLGKISKTNIEQVLQMSLEIPEKDAQIHAPGRMELHYAPITTAYLCSAEQITAIQKGFAFKHVHKLGVMACSDAVKPDENTELVRLSANQERYAHDLYGKLRDLDKLGIDMILVEQPPQTEAWEAVNERLSKAATKFSLRTDTDFEQNDSNELKVILGWLDAVLRLAC